jgi:hypothetical protein
MSTLKTGRVYRYSKTKGAKRLLMVILEGEGNSLGVATTRLDELAAGANIDRRRVMAHIMGLETAGELFVLRREGKHNVYIILPGLTEQDRADAVKFVNTQFRTETPVKLDDLPVTELSPLTRDRTVTPDGISTRDGTVTGQNSVPLTELSPVLGPTRDGTVTGYKDSVVVVDSHDSDQQDQQQQAHPPTPLRLPTELEKSLFKELLVSETIWRGWMIKSELDVIAAYLHVERSDGVENPLGLMRSMLEQERGSPKRKFVEMAQEAIKRGRLEPAPEHDDPLMNDLLREAMTAGFSTVEEYLTAQSVQAFGS